ncbi:hypothetical protein [Dickeya ananatis]
MVQNVQIQLIGPPGAVIGAATAGGNRRTLMMERAFAFGCHAFSTLCYVSPLTRPAQSAGQ